MVDPVAAYFADLGAAVEQQWTKLGRRGPDLSAAAAAALEQVPPAAHVGAMAVLRYAAGSPDLPSEQSKLSDVFGQPPLTMFSAPDFFVQALTWVDGTTSIHQHGFDGAFAVAEGLSLHVPYGFDLAEMAAEDHLVAGELVMGEPEILRPGQVRRIDAGFGFIHALFHLERPTVTIVVRNSSTSLPYPQYTYLRPGLGWDNLWSNRLVGRRLQAIGAMHRLDPPAAEEAAADVVAAAPPWVAFLAVRDALSRSGWSDQVADLCRALRPRVGAVGELLEPALQAEVKQAKVLARRKLLGERHHRTLLALLANLPDEASVRAVIQALYPDQEPSRLVLEWVAELSSPAYRRVSGLVLSEAQKAAVQGFLEGGAPSGDLDLRATLGALAEWWGPPLVLPALLSN